ncbi:hypothetical protein JHK87_032834 [Glycine soja]|nr:hypothetical protein JHK87_032834 [Glycine soja]
MACISKSRAMFFFMAFFVGLLFAAGVSAQTSEFPQAPAPAPTMDAGAGFLVTYSGAFEGEETQLMSHFGKEKAERERDELM